MASEAQVAWVARGGSRWSSYRKGARLVASPKGRVWSAWWRSARTARRWGCTGQGLSVLHEPRTFVEYPRMSASGTPPSCSSRPEGAPAGSGPLIEHHQEPSQRHGEPGGQRRESEVGPGVQICDKGPERHAPGPSGGRYWDRTSDLFRVREARSRCANRPRWVPDSNRCKRLCRPVPSHSANPPGEAEARN